MPTMRRQTLRPRTIDIHARMRIIRSEDDLLVDDDTNNSVSTQISTKKQTFDELVSLHEDLSHTKTSLPKTKRKKDIPIPVTLPVLTYENDISPDFQLPTSYVRFQALPSSSHTTAITTSTVSLQNPMSIHKDLPSIRQVEIDLDLEDMKWLRNHIKYGKYGDPRYQLSLSQFEAMLDVLEKASVIINPNVMTVTEAEDALYTQLGMQKTPLNKVTVDVYNYWAMKRQRFKRPLLRKFWPQTPLNDTNPHLVFRPREKERYKLRKHRKNDMEGYRKLQQLHVDFHKVRDLLALVKRREKLKRLRMEFEDEIRVQTIEEMIRLALHTVVNTTNTPEAIESRKTLVPLVRKPQIPVEKFEESDYSSSMLEKLRKKKKKLRLLQGRHRKDSMDSNISGTESTSTYGTPDRMANIHDSYDTQSNQMKLDRVTATNGLRLSLTLSGSHNAMTKGSNNLPPPGRTGITSSGTTKQTSRNRLQTFIEYDTKKNFQCIETIHSDEEENLNIPYYPSYPMPYSHVMAAMFQQPPKYRCRGRIGRGGRLILDRLPVPTSRYYARYETSAPRLSERAQSMNQVGISSPQSPSMKPTLDVSNDGNATNAQGAIIIHEANYKPIEKALETISSSRLEEIYGQSDSEDEQFEQVSSIVQDFMPSKKANTSGGKGHLSNPIGTTNRKRKVKFTIEI